MTIKESSYFRALYKVAVTINSSLNPKMVLNNIVQSAAETIGAKGISILLLSPDRRELRHTIDHGLSERYLQKGSVSVDRSIAKTLEGLPIVVQDVAADARLQYGREAVEEGIASILSVPMRLKGEVIGVMRVYMAGRTDFTDRDIEFVEAVANLGAVAMDNARCHLEVKDELETVTRYIYSDQWVKQIT